jgi:hypothetical protein
MAERLEDWRHEFDTSRQLAAGRASVLVLPEWPIPLRKINAIAPLNGRNIVFVPGLAAIVGVIAIDLS